MVSKISKNKGFSLVEMSIVIIVIAILFASVIQGSKMMKQARLTSAKSLTQSSPVTVVSGLSFWIETSSDDSFLDTEVDEGSSIGTWRDRNATALTKSTVMQNTAANRPYYTIDNGINSVPTLRFDGSNDYFNTALAGTTNAILVPSSGAITVFAVVRTADVSTARDFFGIGTSTTDGWSVGISNTGVVKLREAGNTSSNTGPTISLNSPVILTIISDATTASFYRNGGTVTSVALANAPTVANPNITVGSTVLTSNPWSGDIAEIIVYNRVVKTQERKDIENYLSKKYSIPVT